MLAESLVVGGVVLLAAAALLSREVAKARGRVRRARWLLTRAAAAIGEARRASVGG